MSILRFTPNHIPLKYRCPNYCYIPIRHHVPYIYVQGELSISYRWTGWVREKTGWSWRRQENHQSFLEESIEYTSNEWEQNRKMSTCNQPVGFRITGILTNYAQTLPGHCLTDVARVWIDGGKFDGVFHLVHATIPCTKLTKLSGTDHTRQFRHHPSASSAVIVRKVAGHHLFLNIILSNFTARTEREVWCDRGISVSGILVYDFEGKFQIVPLAIIQILLFCFEAGRRCHESTLDFD